LRAVFTLSELEELTFTEIALALELPRGTVASRVRRAKERFVQAVRRLQSGGIR
jgi:RNA polymerase sigma-70 factor, ECF subfamily